MKPILVTQNHLSLSLAIVSAEALRNNCPCIATLPPAPKFDMEKILAQNYAPKQIQWEAYQKPKKPKKTGKKWRF